MRKVNTTKMAELTWSSPKGKFIGAGKEISGSGVVRHEDGTTPIEAGDAFIFKPGEPHQITNDTTEDMILYVVADNPIGDTYYQPDSNKWGVPIPERRNVRSEPLDYFDGEE